MQTPIVAEQTYASVPISGSTTLTIAVPPGTEDGDLLVALVGTPAAGAPTITGPAGWFAETSGTGVRTFWRVARNEPASYDWTRSTTTTAFAGIIARVTGSNPGVAVEGGGHQTGTGTTIALPSMTVGKASTLVQLGISFGNVTVTAPGTTTERFDQQNAVPYAFWSGDEQVSPGSTGTRTWTISSSVLNIGAMLRVYPGPTPTGEIYDDAVAADSPLVYYKISEPSGTTMVDSSGNTRDGTYPTPPTLGIASLLVNDPDTAGDFDGTDYGQIASAAWMNTATAFTVEGWMEPDQTATVVHLARRDDAGSNRDWLLRTSNLGSNRAAINWVVWNNSGTLVQATGSIGYTAGSRVHVMVTFNGSTIKIYVGGKLDVSVAHSGTPRALAAAMQFPGPTSTFDGRLQKFAFYGTELSAARAEAHAAAGYYTGNAVSVVDLEPDDALQTHTAEQSALTQVHMLAPQNALQTHTAEQSSLAVTSHLVPADAVQTHTATSSALMQVHTLSPVDAFHDQTVAASSLAVISHLAPENALQTHTAGTSALTQIHMLAPVDAFHSQTVESTSMVVFYSFAPSDTMHHHTATSSRLVDHVVAESDRLVHIPAENRRTVVPNERRTVSA